MNKVNYDKLREEIISNLNGARPRLLLHSCCAPCSSSVLEKLVKHFFVTVFYYNPNQETADLYGILAYWNKCEGMQYEGDEYPSTMEDILNRGNTCCQVNRCKGIDIGCYDNQVDILKYPLKLVSLSYKGTYEECDMRSYGDPEQGFRKTYWKEDDE